MGSAVAVTNWPGVQQPLQAGFYGAGNLIWQNQQANADTWAAQAKASDDAWRAAQEKNLEAWKEDQKNWRTSWGIAQAAYAAAQTLLANKAYEAAKDAADKQYDIANRQQQISDQEYARYTEHFAPCENKTIDEECARPEYTEDIEGQAARAVADVRRQFTIARDRLRRRRNRYCVGPMLAAERQIDIEEARAVADAKEKVRRFLEERQENRRDKYFNRKLQMFNIGRGIKADAVGELGRVAQGIGAGTQIEADARNQFYGAILSGLGGIMGAFLPSQPGARGGFGQQSAGAAPAMGAPVGLSSPATWSGVNMQSGIA